MGAPVNVGTDTITIGSTSSNNRFDGTTISSKQFWINDEFPDGSNERVIIKPGTLSMSNHNTSMDFDDNGLNIVDVGAVKLYCARDGSKYCESACYTKLNRRV